MGCQLQHAQVGPGGVAETGRLLLSKTAVSELGEQLWADYQDFATRDLSEYDISYLFVDGIAERIRPGQRREPVLAAWGFTVEGKKVLLSLMAGSKEDAETVSAFFQDMRGRGLGNPLLVVSDGAPGIIKAVESCFPRSARQRCLAQARRADGRMLCPCQAVQAGGPRAQVPAHPARPVDPRHPAQNRERR